ncbi:MAG: molybdopterin-dependent oxidoreductase [Microlunatus sp.]|nr:molybdopterin-dependent oxidoreductase [Microlunatus sp.]
MPGTAPPRPTWWPHFTSTVRSTALTARLGRALGIAFGVCFLTGLLSYTQYLSWGWLPKPAAPAWGYRLSQGVHVATGVASIPLILVKLWSVYPNTFRWPPARSVSRVLQLISVLLLVSATLVQLVTGFLNLLDWRPFRWDFVVVHYALAYVVIGSVLLHVAIKLPDIRYGLGTRLAEADVLSEIPWDENPASHSNAGPQPAPVTPGISRRGVLIATGAGIGLVVITSVGQTLTPLEPLGLLAVRQPSKGPQGVPVGRTAAEAGVIDAATDPDWQLEVRGPSAFVLGLDEVETLATHRARLPIAAGQGWSAAGDWRGIRLLDLVERAGGDAGSRVLVRSLATGGITKTELAGPQLAAALLATHLNGERLDLDHGYPLRLVGPNRAELFDTKWLGSIEVRR